MKHKKDTEVEPDVIKRKNELFEKYVTPNLNMIYKLCIDYSFSRDTIDENYTSALTNLYRGILTYDSSQSLLTWLHICTKRHIRSMEAKREKHKNNYSELVSVEDSGEEMQLNDEVDFNLITIDNCNKIYDEEIVAAIRTLPKHQREALLMVESGYSFEEIAEIENKRGYLKSGSVLTIRTRVYTARRKLKEYLLAHSYEL